MSAPEKFTIYINESAGTVLSLGQDNIKQKILESELPVKELTFLPAKDLMENLERLEKASGAPPNLLIGGGDGTMTGAAKILLDKEIGFGLLPMGTMNLLAKDLEIPTDIGLAFEAYKKGFESISIDAAFVNEALFLCSAALGMIPESSEFREEHRDDSTPILAPRLAAFVLDRLDHKLRRFYEIHIDQRPFRVHSASLVISNNLFGPCEQLMESNFKRPSLNEGLLGLYSAEPYTFWEKIRLLLKLSLGGWKNDSRIRSWKGKEIIINHDDPEILISVDGETCHLIPPLHFSVRSKALKILVPPN